MNHLGLGYQAAGKLDQALPLLEESLKLAKAKLDADHPLTLTIMNNLGLVYQSAGKLGKALPLWENSLPLMKAKLGADHPSTLTYMNNLASAYVAARKPDQALPLLQEAAAGIEQRRFQHEHADRIVKGLISGYEWKKQFDQAESWRRKLLAVLKERFGVESVPYANELAELGGNLLSQKKWTDAERMLRDALALGEKQQPNAWTTFSTQSLLGGASLGQKKHIAAE
jgi:tetratricopeptide (TPR) repeat protein